MPSVIGYGGITESASARKREAFASCVRDLLLRHCVDLLASEIGRDAAGAVWILSTRLPCGSLATFHLPVRGDPLAPEMPASAAARIAGHLRGSGLVTAGGTTRRMEGA